MTDEIGVATEFLRATMEKEAAKGREEVTNARRLGHLVIVSGLKPLLSQASLSTGRFQQQT